MRTANRPLPAVQSPVMAKKRAGKKLRVEFRQNRQQRRRESDLTRKFREDGDAVDNRAQSETVRAKGELSRKRTVLVDDQNAPRVDEALWLRGVVTAVHGLVCRVDSAGRNWDCVVRRKLRTLLIVERTPVACGDRVWFSDHSDHHDGLHVGVIERVDERVSCLSRRDFRGREHILVANADQLVIVSSVARPRPKPHLIDRYLVAAGRGGMRPVIVFNKCDLRATLAGERADESDLDLEMEEQELPRRMGLDDLLAEYRALGYTVIEASAATGEGVDRVAGEFAGRTSVVSGQSGVGKSSLINRIEPELNLDVGDVSEGTEKGRHTTTHARLVPLARGGYVVDTPGIRQFDVWSVEPGELEAYFAEIAERVAECRFKDCHHTVEDGCAVREAVELGDISSRRYASYLKLLSEMAQVRRERGR